MTAEEKDPTYKDWPFRKRLKFQITKYWKYTIKWFPFALIIGAISGTLMAVFTSLIVNLEIGLHVIPVYIKYPIIGGITSLLLYFGYKEVYGAGISHVLSHKNTTTPLKARGLVTKFFASVLTLGVGAPAGREGPALTLGSTAAYVIGDKIGMSKEDEMHAITIGAAACTAAVFGAPLGGTVFASEVPYKRDLDETVFLPALVASAISFLVYDSLLNLIQKIPFLEIVGFPNLVIPIILSNAMAFIISMDFSLYRGQIQSKEVILRRTIQYTDVLETLTVRESMQDSFVTVNQADKLEEVFQLLYLHKISSLSVVNDQNNLVGMISAIDFQRGFSKGNTLVKDVMTKEVITAFPDESLSLIFDRLTTYSIECLPVIEREQPQRILGILSFRDIESRYETALTKIHSKRKLTIEEIEDDF